ncbi:MAG: ATP-binding protein, partial [Actinomycetota bacterium]
QNEKLQQEIRERQLIEEQLRSSQAEIRGFFEAMADIVIIVDDQGKTLKIAPTNPEKLYPTGTDIISKTVEQFFSNLGEVFRGKIRRALETQQVVNCEYSLRLGQKKIWFSASIAPISEHTVAWVARDISDRKHTEEALQEAVLAADAANHAKSEFLASMSHELRTPLNAILGFSQIISRDQSLSKDHQKHLAIINRAGEHLLALIDDILEVSKIEAGRTTFNENSFNLLTLLDELKKMLQLKAASKGLELIVEYEPNLPQSVKTDEGKLRQVLLNLLGNAIKFTEVGNVTLRVSVREQSAAMARMDNKKLTLHFEIEDTGPGIAPEEIHLLFEAFTQTKTGQKSHQGTGLGLPISKKYVQLMGGEITVSSTPGQGSLFAFNIQITVDSTEVTEATQSYCKVIHLAANQSEYRILIVDDLADSRLLLSEILIPIGFSLREAQNGQEAVKIWQKWQPHLILMDIRMPIMDGYEATQKIRNEEKKRLNLAGSDEVQTSLSQPSQTIIFALSASAFEEQRKIALSAGCDDFIRKPLQAEVLLEKISLFLGVEYEWNLENQTEKIKENSLELLKNDDLINRLSKMPPEWIIKLYDVASECSDDRVLQLLETIPSENEELVRTLRNLAENFQFLEIMLLAQTSKNLSEKTTS